MKIKKIIADKIGIYNMRHLKNLLYLNKNDIILAAYPKVGSTWLRFLFCNLYFLNIDSDRRIDYHTLHDIMPSFGPGKSKTIRKKWIFKNYPRIVKTHKRHNLLFFHKKRTLLMIRDPRDTMISYYHFQRCSKERPFKGDLKDFLLDSDYGLKKYFTFYNSWKNQADFLIKYEDLWEDTFLFFQKLLNCFNIDVQKYLIKEAVDQSSFTTIRRIEKNKGADVAKNFNSNFKFARKGVPGQYKKVFSHRESKIYKYYRDKYNFNLYY